MVYYGNPDRPKKIRGGRQISLDLNGFLDLSVWECWRLKVRNLPVFFLGKIISLVLVPLYHIWLSHLFTSCYILWHLVALCHIIYWISSHLLLVLLFVLSFFPTIVFLLPYHSVPISAQKRRWLRFWVHSPRASLAAPDAGLCGVGRAGPGVSHRENRWRESRNNLRRLIEKWNMKQWNDFENYAKQYLGMEMKVLSHDNDCAAES